jgi:hypothetical protein
MNLKHEQPLLKTSDGINLVFIKAINGETTIAVLLESKLEANRAIYHRL